MTALPPVDPITPTALDVVWAAGFFEGEGSVCISGNFGGRPFRRYRLTADVSNTDLEPLQFLQARWRGHIWARAARKGGRGWARWSVEAGQAAAFYEAIQPHIVRSTVRKRIEIGLEFQRGKRKDWSNRTLAYRQRQDRLVEALHALNARGATPHLTPLEQAVLSGRVS